MDKLANFVMNF